MLPAISSNRLGIKTDNQLHPYIPFEERSQLVDFLGDTIPDYRFWIPASRATLTTVIAETEHVRSHCKTVHLTNGNIHRRRVDICRSMLSLGFTLNVMFILELDFNIDLMVTIASRTEPYNFHPRLLDSGNALDGISITFSQSNRGLTDSLELPIIYAICQSCGMSRL